MSRPRATRWLLALLLAVQAIGAWVPLADARLETGAAALLLEDEPRDDAAQGHLHRHCALCMHLAQREVLAGPAAVPDSPASADGAIDTAAAVADPVLPSLRQGARAPPLA